jgi:rhodanese-related sulfurtransferase
VNHARITAVEAHRLMREQGYLYLDVRTQEEFAAGHPEGAYNVPLLVHGARGRVENPNFLASVRAAFAASDKLVIGCHTGSRSRHAAELLLAHGYRDVVEQRAGFEGARDPFGRVVDSGWRAAGLPCSTQALPGRDYAALERTADPGA